MTEPAPSSATTTQPTQARVVQYDWPFTPPLCTANGEVSRRVGAWVEITDADNHVGVGEAAPWPGWGTPLARCVSDLRRALCDSSPLFATTLGGLDDITATLSRLTLCAEASHAVEVALLDLLAQARQVPLAALFGKPRNQVLVHAMADSAKTATLAVARGARHLKIKVGAHSPNDDYRCLRSIRDAVGPSIALHVDVNGAWDVATANTTLQHWRTLDIDLVEQPMPPTLLSHYAELRQRTGVKIALDESVRTLGDLRQIVVHQAADVIVIKPMLTGGLLAAQQLATAAHSEALEVILTSVLETAVGRTATLHLASALMPEPRACGLSGRMASDGTRNIADRSHLNPAANALGLMLSLPACSGLGVELETPHD